VRNPDPGPEESQVIVDLGHGADGGTRILAGRLLLDRDGGRQALDRIHVRLLHEPEELPGIRGKRLDVPALTLGIDGVEGERGFA
jgi:hypothetical protein